MLDDQSGCLLRCELGQGHGGFQHLTHIGDRQSREFIHRILINQVRITRLFGFPVQAGFGDEPARQNGQCQLMFPGTILNRLEFVPTEFGFGILNAAFDETALCFALGQHRQR